ncbi:DUF6584 family protein [Chryseobacterium sp. SIMBA_029]|uniref:DUF6584 family protein n=1 Tax=Chryseobacterium sp. SIMBA_029 TaxID=3085772 RepID=UPI0039785A0B
MGNIFYRIEQDLKAGRKKKASDRLRNLINEFPDDISLREKLGQIYYNSGFKDEAGKFWILSEPKNQEMKEAVEIYRNSLSNSGSTILKDIVFRGDKNKLTDYSKKVLEDLESDSFKKTKYIPDFNRKQREKGIYQESKDSLSSKIGMYFLGAIIILIPVLGFFKLFELLKSLLLK